MPDSDGYPTEEELSRIADWDVEPDDAWHELLAFCQSLWRYPDYFSKHGPVYRVSTGGWSGNEWIIDALRDNTMFWLFYWQSSRRGGHYTFCEIGDRDAPTT